MSFDQEYPLPEQPSQLPPARRRRARRSLIPASNDARAEVLENLARRAFPSFEFFLFSLLGGAVLGAGYIFDSQSILLLGILIAPLITPWVGIVLATVTGSGRFFLQTLAGFIISAGLVFGSSLLAGTAARVLPPQSFLQAIIHSHLWWANIFVLVLGSILLVISFVRSEKRPILPSVMLTYELFLPLSAAGFGLGSGFSDFWPNGILVFYVHLALATLVGLLTLVMLGFRPRRLPGCLMSLIIGLLALAVFIWLSGLNSFFLNSLKIPSITASGSETPAVIQTIMTSLTAAESSPPANLESTRTPTLKIPTAQNLTSTPTPEATPVYARVNSAAGQGANVRATPGSDTILVSLINDSLVEILPEVQILNGITWLHIRTAAGIEGWILQTLVITATPATGW
ncbi:MAG: hypothetical protein A2X25_15070 [Chloroflexi bacterium GWB2_49_20]|nr:MAG: hypothetical protein A2X25_15070 [Chloroflexi bacterium GWB2_49_20]OGN80380.1 MAG: hypothetical protein A2X26_13835 [Chloroflexi bacterium GWC2_49_37]OGN84278.1 MAG: hypothetical protein A2X27_12615 [Chloroflexi bacterium GWD2_49_16]